jgi:hypothetical protein
MRSLLRAELNTDLEDGDGPLKFFFRGPLVVRGPCICETLDID